MAEPLKLFFSRQRVRAIGASIVAVHPSFDAASFERAAIRGLDALEMLGRGRHIMEALRAHLPARYDDALEVIVRSLGPEHAGDELDGGALASFFYLPHTDFVRVHGLSSFDLSMRAQVELTKRFTCEFSVRPFLEHDPERAHRWLREWTKHESAHVRRLVSEGTRIRLPWASRIPTWEKDLDRIVGLLDLLKDDPSTVVRRSVANNLNDIAKVDPPRVVAVAARWLEGASDERRRLVEHALRTLVKRGDREALALLGFGEAARVALVDARFSPRRVAIGGKVEVSFTLINEARTRASLLVDLVVRFVKQSGTSAKVFKLKRVDLAPGERAGFAKTISLAVHTTRKPYPGEHVVEVLVNGAPMHAGAFVVTR